MTGKDKSDTTLVRYFLNNLLDLPGKDKTALAAVAGVDVIV